MKSSFNFSFLKQLIDLLVFRIMKLESTSRIMAQLDTIPKCLPFFSLKYTYI